VRYFPVLALVLCGVVIAGGVVVQPAEASTAIGAACPSAYATGSVHTDVKIGSAHTPAIMCMWHWKVVASPSSGKSLTCNGGCDASSKFSPGRDATRAEFAGFLYQLLVRAGKAPAAGANPFSDVASSHPQYQAIVALAGAGVIKGTTATTFSPGRAISRGQMASLITRAHQAVYERSLPVGATFSDIAGTTHETAIRRLTGANIASGYPDGTYRPEAKITRAQTASFVARYADLLVVEQLAARPKLRALNSPGLNLALPVTPPISPPAGATLLRIDEDPVWSPNTRRWVYTWTAPSNFQAVCDATVAAMEAKGLFVNVQRCASDSMRIAGDTSNYVVTVSSYWDGEWVAHVNVW
jgi:hypothetical protein